MKVLHLIKSLGRGGAEMLLPETIAIHSKGSFRFHCIYFLPWKNQMVAALEAEGVQVTCLEAHNNLQMLGKINAVIRYCRMHQIELIHCHLPWAGFVGRIVQRLTGIPVVYTEHNKQERYNRITARLNRLTFNWQNLAIAVSADVSTSIQKNIATSIPIKTVLNGVNTDKYKRADHKGLEIRRQYGIDENAFVVGTVAVFRFQKRLCEWLEVLKTITDKFPYVQAVVVGDGPLKDEIKVKCKALGLEDKVVFPGLQTNTIDWFSSMDVFMMSSEFEGLPLALLEAMSCGTAVASTDAGGIKEVIRHETDGLLVPVDRWQDLKEEVSRLINDKLMLADMKKAARQRVVESFSLQKMVTDLEAVYSGLLEQDNPGRHSVQGTMETMEK